MLIAVFSGAVSSAFYKSEKDNSEKFVYCPLTKKLQPVNPPKKNLLNPICASDDQKDRFALEIFKEINSGFTSLNEKQFEKIVFDYFQNGKSAFGSLPKTPEFPHKNLAKNFDFGANAGNKKKQQFVPKIQNENFSFARNPRPPDLFESVEFEIQIVRALEEISQNIKPRSPPAHFS